MAGTDTLAVAMLSTAHAEGLRALSAEFDVAGVLGAETPFSPDEAADYIATSIQARGEGRSYIFVLTKGTDVIGICRLIGVLGVPRIIVAVSQRHRGQGHGLFLVRHVVEFAFGTLRLGRVTATGACLQILSQCGMQSQSNTLTREEWEAFVASAK